MALVRIYDAQFDQKSDKKHHAHLDRFWWVNITRARGVWTRQQAYDYVLAYLGEVYVGELGRRVEVLGYRHPETGTVWIQTVAGAVLRDNLLTVARHRDDGLPNR
jgi:hypothetical protein